MHLHRLPVEQVLASLQAEAGGLAEAEALRRAAEFGPNRVARVKRDPWALRLGREFVHFFAVILWVAAGLAFFAGARDPEGGMTRMGWAIVGVIGVNGLFSFWQEARAERAIQALERLLPDRVKVRRDGALQERPAADLVPGDVIELEAGDGIPADCRLLEVFGAQVSAATLTGESVPLARQAEPDPASEPIHARNLVLAGTDLVAGQATAVVYATGMHTELGRIAHLTQAGPREASPLQREIARVSHLIALLAVGLGAAFYAAGHTLHLTPAQNLLFAVGIIVANVPEGLLPTVTLALAMAAQRMARRNALVRRLPAVETLGEATVICTDKTGTLTQNRMAVLQVWLEGRWAGPADLRQDSAPAFFRTAAHCHNLHGGANGHLLGDPMELALVALARQAGVADEVQDRVDLLPFDAGRRRLSVLLRERGALVLHAKGALEFLLPCCSAQWVGGAVVPLEEADRARILRAQAEAADGGLRVLAFATREVAPGEPKESWETGLVFTGLAALEDPPRPEVADAVRRCREASIRVVMVTGDHPRTAEAIARQIGLVTGAEVRVITGEMLRHLTETQLRLALDHPDLVFARLDPDQKTRIVQALQAKGEVVAVTGDGVNDAPALKAADIGVAMGRDGTDVAREAADLVLADDNFASIVAAVEEGRAIFDNVRKFLTYHMTSNCGELLPFLAFAVLGIPLPLTIIQVLIIDLGTDMLPALALGAEVPEAGIMSRPPRARGDRLLTGRVFLRAYPLMGLLEGAAGLAAYAATLQAGGWTWGRPLPLLDPLSLSATTACLSGVIAGQMVNVFLCRSERESILKTGIRGNGLLLLGVATEVAVLLAIHHLGWVQQGLGTLGIPAAAWWAMLPFLGAMIAVEEARKALQRRWGPGG